MYQFAAEGSKPCFVDQRTHVFDERRLLCGERIVGVLLALECFWNRCIDRGRPVHRAEWILLVFAVDIHLQIIAEQRKSSSEDRFAREDVNLRRMYRCEQLDTRQRGGNRRIVDPRTCIVVIRPTVDLDRQRVIERRLTQTNIVEILVCRRDQLTETHLEIEPRLSSQCIQVYL